MKNYSKLFFLFFLFTFFPAKAFSQDLTSGMVLNLSQGDNVDKSQILGLEWIHHYKNQEAPDSNLVPGFGLGIQQQSWGSGDFSRLAFSLSLNQYLDYESGWLGNLEYIGLKWSIYTGLGKTADALDCLFVLMFMKTIQEMKHF